MTDAERRLLEMAKPDVVLQADPVPPMGRSEPDEDGNPHFLAAARLVSKGWLEFVEDGEFNQSRYRITPAGAASLQTR